MFGYIDTYIQFVQIIWCNYVILT